MKWQRLRKLLVFKMAIKTSSGPTASGQRPAASRPFRIIYPTNPPALLTGLQGTGTGGVVGRISLYLYTLYPFPNPLIPKQLTPGLDVSFKAPYI